MGVVPSLHDSSGHPLSVCWGGPGTRHGVIRLVDDFCLSNYPDSQYNIIALIGTMLVFSE